jgi:hypothetical protein
MITKYSFYSGKLKCLIKVLQDQITIYISQIPSASRASVIILSIDRRTSRASPIRLVHVTLLALVSIFEELSIAFEAKPIVGCGPVTRVALTGEE